MTKNHQNQKRILWIDYAKFIGISLVVCAHQTDRDGWFTFISAFTLPLFFFLSGYLFSFKKFDSYASFLKARTKQLLIPYFLLNLIAYALWLVFFRKFDENFAISQPSYRPFIGIFYGNGHDSWLIHCVASWFIICLFTLENIYFLLFRNAKGAFRFILLAGIFIVSLLDQKYDPIRWPWGFNPAIIGLIFYGTANILKEETQRIMNLPLPRLIALSVPSLLVVYFVSTRNYVDMLESTYGNFYLFIIGAFSGILFALTLSRMLDIVLGPVWVFQYLAQNTLVILAFHTFLISLSRNFIALAFDIPSAVVIHSRYLSLIVVAATLALSLPLIHLCNKYLPIMVGRPYKPKQQLFRRPQEIISQS
ncbi:acyltransferase family protein [Parapedobacter koreensis]|uniref:Fucose 4-O-acetylase n=1 Tax=Parapedobacter koreensis TaxID=332977 RepID=A0A1H7II01_9SPHI|nr:acyltransferase family protein [Parapedobacter koreensis]SEK62183.1 Fucose 4-O-acetylase [Parapedobacter koreensis]